jgi:hypothetical protein
MMSVEQQLACLRCAARHLAPGGRFTLDVFLPDERALARNLEHAGLWRVDLEQSDGATRLIRSVRVRPRRAEQVLGLTMRYETYGSDGSLIETEIEELEMRYFYRFEAEHLLARAGLEIVAAWGGYDRQSISSDSKSMLFVCAARSRKETEQTDD